MSNTPGHSERDMVLRQVLDGALDVGDAALRLDGFELDVEVPLVVASVGDVRASLLRYLDGEWAPSQLEAWADFIEWRDDIGMPEAADRGLREVVFEVASSALFGELTPERVRSLLDELEQM